jgi:nitrogen fixation protein FixH
MKKIHPWPLALTVILILFLVAVIGGAWYFSTVKVDMVSSDYYEKGQKFQTDIDARSRTAALPWKVRIAFDGGAHACAILFPDSVRNISGGSLTFFCVADAQSDFHRELALGAEGRQIVPMAGARPGLWRVKLSWQMAGLDYYAEEKIVVE